MESYLFLIALLIASIALYRRLSRRFVSPQAVVRGLLRRYHVFEKAGLPEAECLFRLLSTRRGWKKLPGPFLIEIVARLGSKEDVMRFVSLAEGYRFDQTHFPHIAKKEDPEAAMAEVASLFTGFGSRLQDEGRLKQAEFVQKLALRLQPHQCFTNLPLAVTYYRMDRFSEAAPLFKRGLAHFEKFQKEAKPTVQTTPAANWFGPNADLGELKASYQTMYEACLKAKRAGKD